MTAPSRRLVSVVIPTIGRPLVVDAVRSVLAQTAHLHEVVVAADTDAELRLPDDPRVTLLRVGPGAGGNAARMAGVRVATGDLIAFLDDDDTWRPDKLERQLELVDRASLTGDEWIASSTVLRSSGRVWPERVIRDDEDIADYLFRKTALRGGQGALHTSTILAPRTLVQRIPFDPRLRFHQDTTWLIELRRRAADLRVLQVDAPLVSVLEAAGSVSRGITASQSLQWVRRTMHDLPRQARADFVLTITYHYALRRRDVKGAIAAVRFALRAGPPSVYGATTVLTMPAKMLFETVRAR